MRGSSVLVGVVLGLAARAALPQLLRWKFQGDVARLNAGDASTLLASYADDAVLHFNTGDHRWAGDWIGRAAIGAFLQNFTAARIQGQLGQIAATGPPWALVLMARFDDFADRPDGVRAYESRTVLVLRTRWGKIVDHEDFYVDTERITAFDRTLTAAGVAAVPRD